MEDLAFDLSIEIQTTYKDSIVTGNKPENMSLAPNRSVDLVIGRCRLAGHSEFNS